MNEQYAALAEQVRVKKPLIHHITNYVTVNDCANITLAVGASPIMADALEEAADIARISSALVINMGTLNERTIQSMLAAGKAANKSCVPVIFDPVGAGASEFRNKTATRLLNEVKISVLRGNISEVCFLAGIQSDTKGVDASENDLKNTTDAATVAKTLSDRLNCVVAITGAVDVVSDGKKIICIENGQPMLTNLTGTGCMCSSLIGSFCGAAPGKLLEATSTALLTMGIAGEIAYEKAGGQGIGNFRVALHDAVSRMDAVTLTRRAKVYEA
jgi:hydroxyethylthiazole kinase